MAEAAATEAAVLHSNHVFNSLRLHSLAQHIKALKAADLDNEGDESWQGWTTDVEFRVWREYFTLGLDRSLALAHQAVWRREMKRYNLLTTFLSAIAALIGTLGLAIFRDQQEQQEIQVDTEFSNSSVQGEFSPPIGYNVELTYTHVGSYRWWWSLSVTLISLCVTGVSAHTAKRAPKAEAAIKNVDRYTIWVRRCRATVISLAPQSPPHPMRHAWHLCTTAVFWRIRPTSY